MESRKVLMKSKVKSLLFTTILNKNLELIA